MSDPSRVPVTHTLSESAPSSRQAVKVLTAATVGVSLSFLFGLTLTGTVLGLILATPVLVLFSPILVPAAVASFLVASGFVFSGGCGVAAVTTLSWMYSYVTGKRPPGADTVDYARKKIVDAARSLKERAKEYGHSFQPKTGDPTPGS